MYRGSRQILDGVIFTIFVSICHSVLGLIGGQTAKLIFRVSSTARNNSPTMEVCSLQCNNPSKDISPTNIPICQQQHCHWWNKFMIFLALWSRMGPIYFRRHHLHNKRGHIKAWKAGQFCESLQEMIACHKIRWSVIFLSRVSPALCEEKLSPWLSDWGRWKERLIVEVAQHMLIRKIITLKTSQSK